MGWPPAGPHAIRRNHGSRVPRRFVYLDTEASRTPTEAGELQTWMVGVTAFDDLSRGFPEAPRAAWGVHTTPAECWDWIDARTKAKTRTVLVCHNLGYDMRISAAVTELPRLGWEHQRTRFATNATWSRWARGERTLVCVDLFSWLPKPLWEVGELLGLRKERLPDAGDTFEDYVRRCRRDVEITREAWLQILRFLEDEDLGTWQMTGNGQAWSAWRHRFYNVRVTASMDPAQHGIERDASMTGRCEVWRHGPTPPGRYVEWDYRSSYATLARDNPVPVRFLGPERRPERALEPPWPSRVGYLAEVNVSTEVPVVPARRDGRILWPVGEFTTTAFGPELELLREKATSVTVVRAWAYELAPALRRFCGWALSVADGEDDDTHPVVRAVCHQWGRSLIGRFGMRYSKLEDFGRARSPDYLGFELLDLAKGSWHRGIQVGDRVQLEGDIFEPRDSCPAVMGWIMSLARVRLWRLMERVGFEHVLYVDTDSVLVDEPGDRRLARMKKTGPLEGVRRKGAWGSLDLRAPRQIILGDTLRAAGVPKKARTVDGRTWAGTTWRGFHESLRLRETDRVVLTDREFTLDAPDHRREHLPQGLTAPYRLP